MKKARKHAHATVADVGLRPRPIPARSVDDRDKKEYDFRGARRGRFATKSPTLEGKGVTRMHPRIVNVNFDVTQEVAAALRALRDTGLWGNGCDCASVAEELLRKALLDPEIVRYWKKP